MTEITRDPDSFEARPLVRLVRDGLGLVAYVTYEGRVIFGRENLSQAAAPETQPQPHPEPLSRDEQLNQLIGFVLDTIGERCEGGDPYLLPPSGCRKVLTNYYDSQVTRQQPLPFPAEDIPVA